MNGYEVVKVNYDPEIISETALEAHAEKAQCTLINGKGKFREDKYPQYYLKQSNYKYLPLSPIQKTKINSALKNRADATLYLSPRQMKWLGNIRKYNPGKKLWYDENFAEGWAEVSAQDEF